MANNSIEDYPFTSWKTFYAAFVECNSTEFYAETYPKFAEAIDKGDSNIVPIMLDFLEKGHDPQEGLDGFIQAMLDGSRYSKDYLDDLFPDMVKHFIAKGAKLNIEPLITAEYDDIEDEMCGNGNGSIKGAMLAALKQEKIIPDMDTILNEKLKWENLLPCYWEYIPYHAYDAYTQFRMALKFDYLDREFCSETGEYLSTDADYCMKIAIHHIRHWRKGDELNFTHLVGLTEIPELPEGLTDLNCEGLRKLTKLPDTLPLSLTNLQCRETSLTYLPSMPPNLVELDCSNTRISELPLLPDSLEKLYISGVRIKTLPDPLPTSLHVLERYSYPYGEPLGKYLPKKNHLETITKYLERISTIL